MNPSRLTKFQRIKEKKKKKYSTYAGAVLLAAMIPYVTVPTYALLTDHVKVAPQLTSAFVFPAHIQSLVDRAEELKSAIDQNATDATNQVEAISTEQTVEAASSHISAIQSLNNSAKVSKAALDSVIKELQSYYDRALLENEKGQYILGEVVNKEQITAKTFTEVQSFLNDGSIQTSNSYSGGSEDLLISKSDIEMVKKSAAAHGRIYTYVEKGNNDAAEKAANAQVTIDSFSSILQNAEAAVATVELRIEEERKKLEEEKKKLEEQQKLEDEKKKAEEQQKLENEKKQEAAQKENAGIDDGDITPPKADSSKADEDKITEEQPVSKPEEVQQEPVPDEPAPQEELSSTSEKP